jgi:hypothetical protein
MDKTCILLILYIYSSCKERKVTKKKLSDFPVFGNENVD